MTKEMLEVPVLTDTARAALIRVARLMSEGFTGEIVLECSQGGLRRLKAGLTWTGEDLRQEELADDRTGVNSKGGS